MRCPECYKKLKKASAHGIELDGCPACLGIWFDAGELEAYRQSRALASGRDAEPITFETATAAHRSDCPRCESATLLEGRAGDIPLWRCSECGGCFRPAPEGDGAGETRYGALDLAWDAWLTLDFLDAAADLFDP